MAEHEPWHAPTGLSGLDEPAQLWWWVLVGHARELDYLTRELNLTAEQRRQLMRLQTVHRQEVATLAGHPDSRCRSQTGCRAVARPLTSRKHRTRAELAGHLTYAGCCGLSPGLSGAVRGSRARETATGRQGLTAVSKKAPAPPSGGGRG